MSGDSLRSSAAIFEHAPVGLAGLDVEGVLVQVNTHFAHLLGCRIEQVVGCRLHDLIIEPYGVEFTACLADIARGAEVEGRLEIPVRHGDRDMTWVTMTLVRMGESLEQGPGISSMIVDIREHHGQASQTLVDRLMQASPAVVYTMRPENLATMTFVSQNVANVTGWSPQAIAGRPDWLEEHVHPEDFQRVYDDLTRWLARDAPGYARIHYRQRTPEGRWQWLDDQLTTVRDSRGRVVELVGAFRDVTDRVEITRRLEKLARNVPGVLFQYRQDPDGQAHFTYASEGALDILGLPHEEMEADAAKAFDRVHPDDLPTLLASIEKSRCQLTPWQLRLRFLHPQRGEIWLEGRSSPEEEEGGSVLWHGVLLDISREVVAEKALQQSRAELAEAQQLAHLGSWVWSVDTDDLRWSEEMFRIFGVTSDAFIPTFEGFMQRVHDEDRERVRAAVGEALTGSPYEIDFRLLRPDGFERIVNARGTVEFSTNEQPLRMIGSVLDVTRLRAMEAEQRLLAATFHSSQAIFITDSDGTIQRVNPGFTALLGYTPDQVVGQNPRVFHSSKQGPEFYRNIFDHIEEKGYWEGEIWNLHRSGKVIPLHEFITAIYDPGGRLEHYIATFFDISRQKELESRLEYLALYDPLTETANRRHIEPLMEHEARRASRYGNPCSLVMLDLDHFKSVNDTFGHDLGDEILRRVVATLEERLRDTDVLGRWGGEEFIVLLPDTNGDHAKEVAEQLRLRVERTEMPKAGRVTISLGVSEYHPEESIKDWVKRADDAMYSAKKAGRNRVG
ncbi:PAS domain-containing protein [Halomonas sp. C05BenzN]|uniref:PAS domain-containing protein n=1 Tax=Halomonas sp. C05BenzN TaxID=3411041 RepID=UPI003B926ED0